MIQRWGVFAASVFLLIGVTLASLRADPVAEHGIVMRYAFWIATAGATFLSWWLSRRLVVSGRDQPSRRRLVASSLVATLLFVPLSMALDVLFQLPDPDAFNPSQLLEEWLVSAIPVFASCMIASLPALLAARAPAVEQADAPTSDAPQPDPTDTVEELLPPVVRGGIVRATADLQYVHLHSPEGVTTVPGPMHRIIELMADQGLEVRRGDWVADRHVKQVKSVRGRWVVLLKDGQQVAVSRRRLADVKKRWGSTRYA